MSDDMVVVKTCPECGAVFYGDGEPHYCLKCNVRLQKSYKPKTHSIQAQQIPQYVPRCPTCGSPDLAYFGPNGIGGDWARAQKPIQYKCNNCGYRW